MANITTQEVNFTVLGVPLILRVISNYDCEIFTGRGAHIHFYFRFFFGGSKGFRIITDPEIGIMFKNTISIPLIGFPHSEEIDYKLPDCLKGKYPRDVDRKGFK